MAQTNGVNGAGHDDEGIEVFTDYLIVGTGPAGGALASFLTQHGERIGMHDTRVVLSD